MVDFLPPIEKRVRLPIHCSVAYRLWTTQEGLISFFAEEARFELRSGGPFEILFDKDEPPGEQGSEGCQVLAWMQDALLVVSWNAPPEFPAERAEISKPEGARPFVVVRFEALGPDETDVYLHHGGMPDRDRWPEVRDYFVRAWSAVLCWLETRVVHGPIPWEAGPPPRPSHDYEVSVGGGEAAPEPVAG